MDRKIQRLTDWFPELTAASLHIDEVVTSPYAYSQEMIKFIDENGRIHKVVDFGHYWSLRQNCIKFEQCEKLSSELFSICQQLARKFNHQGPVTCHLFVAPEGSVSFPMHTDPDDVMLYIVSGQKTMRFEQHPDEVLSAGDALYIPHGTHHQAINSEASVMLSFGLERFTMEKINDVENCLS